LKINGPIKVRVMVFNATFNNISVISWGSVLLVEETGGPGENQPRWHKSLTNSTMRIGKTAIPSIGIDKSIHITKLTTLSVTHG
jgi:hypothetical protein